MRQDDRGLRSLRTVAAQHYYYCVDSKWALEFIYLIIYLPSIYLSFFLFFFQKNVTDGGNHARSKQCPCSSNPTEHFGAGRRIFIGSEALMNWLQCPMMGKSWVGQSLFVYYLSIPTPMRCVCLSVNLCYLSDLILFFFSLSVLKIRGS